MDDILKAALEIVATQATTRPMTEDEILRMIKSVANGIALACTEPTSNNTAASQASLLDPKKAIKESTITCLECGNPFKVLTQKHIASHNLTPEAYKEKYDYKKTQPLCSKRLQRERRKKMKEMRLWERRAKAE